MKRELEIIEILSKQSTYISLEELSDFFNVTTRTIRDDIEKIEALFKNTSLKINQDKNLGIRLNGNINSKEEYYKLIQNIQNETDYYIDSERTELIIQKLFLSNEPCLVSELVDLTKSSKTTVVKNMYEISLWLKKRNIKMIHDKKGIYLEYKEIDFRRAMLEYIALYFKNILIQNLYDYKKNYNLIIFDIIINSFLKEVMHFNYDNAVNKFIKKFETLEDTSFTDEAYLNSYFMICIALKRINSGKILTNVADNSLLVKKLIHYDEWINKHKQELELETKTTIPESEFFAILAFLQVQNKRKANSLDFKDEELVLDFIKEVQNQLHVNLMNDKELFESLLIHLSQMVNRAVFGINVLTPPVKEDVKYLYKDVYNACKNTANFFKEKIGVVPNDDEMAYLTIHIAASIERTKIVSNKEKKIKALIVCVSGIGTSNLLYNRVCNEFPNIVIKRICSVKEFDETNDDDIDIIISTTPLYESNRKCVYVSPLLSEKDIASLKKHLSIESNERSNDKTIDIYELIRIIASECTINNQQQLFQKLSNFLNVSNNIKCVEGQLLSSFAIEDHVLINANAKDYKEAITLSGQLLFNTGTIKKRFIKSMINSKKLLGPNIVISEGLAFPHARPEDGAIRLGMSFVTLENPLNFGNKELDPVRLIISLSAIDKTSHLRALSELMLLVNYPSVLKKLVNAKTYQEFYRELINFENIYCRNI